MIAAEAFSRYRDMQIVGVHSAPDAVSGMVLELAVPGGYPARTWVTVEVADGGQGSTRLKVTETVDPPAPRYRNRRGYTDAATLAQHHIDQGDDRAERDREQNDDRYDVT